MKSIDMLTFVTENKQKILDCLRQVTKQMPSAAGGVDFRNQISHIYCRMLERTFPGIFDAIYDEEYDLMYLLDTDGKISMKSMEKIFQRLSKKSKIEKMTKPSNIMFINCLGENRDEKLNKALENISWLLVIQRGKVNEENSTVTIGFAVISSQHLKRLIKHSPECVKRTNDQIQLIIPNEKYDYFSGLQEVPISNDNIEHAERNRNFYSTHKIFCDGILDFVPSIMSKNISVSIKENIIAEPSTPKLSDVIIHH